MFHRYPHFAVNLTNNSLINLLVVGDENSGLFRLHDFEKILYGSLDCFVIVAIYEYHCEDHHSYSSVLPYKQTHIVMHAVICSFDGYEFEL
jgi:hypothetical protein